MKKHLTVILVATTLIVTTVLSRAVADDLEANDKDAVCTTGAAGQMGLHLRLSDHMTMTESRPMTPADTERGEKIIATMRAKLAKYEDYKVAIADGYQPYMESVPQDVYHFANRELTASEYMGDFDLAHPGSLLYEKKMFGGYKLVGAMYDAPEGDTPEQLDALIPLSLSHWHAHTNICLPNGVTEADVMNGNIAARMRPDISSAGDAPEQFGRGGGAGESVRMRVGYLADPRFGFTGTISNQADCEAADGNFHKQIFGWMIHVYPFASDDMKVAFSLEAP
ncbi:MAG: hypothetical protein WCD12_21395 [Candidatus Binatus sp.]|jgi:hypothetical protein|uniref:hypothetical protein n=1 Tax=Candidatus Binatus sp. TaxID=2811406 RepID=UPI003C740C49